MLSTYPNRVVVQNFRLDAKTLKRRPNMQEKLIMYYSSFYKWLVKLQFKVKLTFKIKIKELTAYNKNIKFI